MKVVYTPRSKRTGIEMNTISAKYNCDAYDYFKEKRKDDLTEIVAEINRREKEKYHLPVV